MNYQKYRYTLLILEPDGDGVTGTFEVDEYETIISERPIETGHGTHIEVVVRTLVVR